MNKNHREYGFGTNISRPKATPRAKRPPQGGPRPPQNEAKTTSKIDIDFRHPPRVVFQQVTLVVWAALPWELPQGPRGAPMCAYKVIDYQRSIQYTSYIIKYTVYRVQYTGIQYAVYKYTGFLSIQYTSIQGKGTE